jgi:hypothetical protein
LGAVLIETWDGSGAFEEVEEMMGGDLGLDFELEIAD